jgi:hypothetical protein
MPFDLDWSELAAIGASVAGGVWAWFTLMRPALE